MATIEAGQVVVLRSGGPEMTVGMKMSNGTYRCSWFDQNATLGEGDFLPDALKVLKEKEKD